MNTAQSFITTITNLTITFKPTEKGKDRPVQTMTFLDVFSTPTGPQVNTQITYMNVKGQNIMVVRQVSVVRAMEYIVEASTQSYKNPPTTK